MTGRLVVAALVGRLVTLEPLAERHLPGLAAAAAEDRGTYGFTSVPDGSREMAAYVDELLQAAEAGQVVPFAQACPDGRVVGATRYLDLRRLPGADRPYALEVGGTWLAASAQRTGMNLEAKLLLLRHAFEVVGVARVDFRTDARNLRSRRAIEGLGAVFEGVLRSSQRSHVRGEEGRLRDSAVFSVVADEWPAVQAALEVRLRRC